MNAYVKKSSKAITNPIYNIVLVTFLSLPKIIGIGPMKTTPPYLLSPLTSRTLSADGRKIHSKKEDISSKTEMKSKTPPYITGMNSTNATLASPVITDNAISTKPAAPNIKHNMVFFIVCIITLDDK